MISCIQNFCQTFKIFSPLATPPLFIHVCGTWSTRLCVDIINLLTHQIWHISDTDDQPKSKESDSWPCILATYLTLLKVKLPKFVTHLNLLIHQNTTYLIVDLPKIPQIWLYWPTTNYINLTADWLFCHTYDYHLAMYATTLSQLTFTSTTTQILLTHPKYNISDCWLNK